MSDMEPMELSSWLPLIDRDGEVTVDCPNDEEPEVELLWVLLLVLYSVHIKSAFLSTFASRLNAYGCYIWHVYDPNKSEPIYGVH